jgi:hypothetical protein
MLQVLVDGTWACSSSHLSATADELGHLGPAVADLLIFCTKIRSDIGRDLRFRAPLTRVIP